MFDKTSLKYWIAICAIAFALRIAGAFYWDSRYGGELFFGDSATYAELGKRIAQGKTYDYEGLRIMRMPGYPLLLSPIYMIFGNEPSTILLRSVGVFFGTLCVPTIGLLAFAVTKNRIAAILSGSIIAVDPNQVVSSVLVLSEAPFSFFLILQLYAWCKAIENRSKIWGILFGLLSACALYCRPSWLLFVPFLFGIQFIYTLLLRKKSDWILPGLISVLVFTVAMSPWCIRNYFLSGHFIVTTLQGGASLYDGLNPEASGASDMRFVEKFRRLEQESPSMDPEKEMFEYRLDERMKRASTDWAKSNPSKVAELAGIKFLRMWNIRPNESAFSSTFIALTVMLSYVPVLLCAIAGTYREKEKGFSFVILWVPAIYLTLLHMIFVSSLRYRTPAMLILAIPAALLVANIITRDNIRN